MKKITEVEFNEIPRVRTGKYHPVKDLISKLDVKQGVSFTIKEWGLKSHPAASVKTSSLKNKQFRFKRLEDKSGWAVLRVK